MLSFSKCCIFRCPNVCTKTELPKISTLESILKQLRFHGIRAVKKLRFHTCGWGAKTKNKLLHFQMKTDRCRRGLRSHPVLLAASHYRNRVKLCALSPRVHFQQSFKPRSVKEMRWLMEFLNTRDKQSARLTFTQKPQCIAVLLRKVVH